MEMILPPSSSRPSDYRYGHVNEDLQSPLLCMFTSANLEAGWRISGDMSDPTFYLQNAELSFDIVYFCSDNLDCNLLARSHSTNLTTF